MISESGSLISGRFQMRYGLQIVVRPGRERYPHLGTHNQLTSTGETLMKTVLITGCSSGYALETARYFLAQGWNVLATMPAPREDVLPRSEGLRVLALDVTSAKSITAA